MWRKLSVFHAMRWKPQTSTQCSLLVVRWGSLLIRSASFGCWTLRSCFGLVLGVQPMISRVVQKTVSLYHYMRIGSFHDQHKQMKKLIFHSLALVSCSLMSSHWVQTSCGERIEQVLSLWSWKLPGIVGWCLCFQC